LISKANSNNIFACLVGKKLIEIPIMSSIYGFYIDLNARIRSQLEQIAEKLKLDRICVFRLENNNPDLMHKWPKEEQYAMNAEWSKLHLENDLQTIFKRLKSFHPFFDPFGNLDSKQRKVLSNLGIKAAIFIPIQNEGRLWGFLGCFSERSASGWKSAEVSIALHESMDLIHTILFSETLAELKEADENLQLLMGVITEGIVTLDIDGLITNISGHVADLGGYHIDELIGKDFKNFIHKDDWNKLERDLELAKGKEKVIAKEDYRLVMKTGDIYWSRAASISIFKHGQHSGYLCVLFNIHRYKCMEEELRCLKSAMHDSCDLIWITDLGLKFTYISPSVYNILGYPVNQAMCMNAGLTVAKTTLERLGEAFIKGLKAVKKDDLKWRTTIPVEQFTKTGKKLSGKMLLKLHLDMDGKPQGFMGITNFKLRQPFGSNPFGKESSEDESMIEPIET
jgi:PAS domain S-box-containing protein